MAGLNTCKTIYEFVLSILCFIICYVQQRGPQRSICKFMIMIILYRFHKRQRCKQSQIIKTIIVALLIIGWMLAKIINSKKESYERHFLSCDGHHSRLCEINLANLVTLLFSEYPHFKRRSPLWEWRKMRCNFCWKGLLLCHLAKPCTQIFNIRSGCSSLFLVLSGFENH